MTIEARMRCSEKTERQFFGSDEASVTVKLTAIRTGDPSDPTDSFATATPAGELTLTIQRAAAAAAFKAGSVYSILIEELP